MKIAVSGISGFVGTNLKAHLSARHNIVPLNVREPVTPGMLAGVDAIVHLAGKAHDLKKVTDAAEYYRVNYKITKTLYDAFLTSNVEKFIFISSVKAAADKVDGVLNELIVPMPDTEYGKSKLKAEQYIESCVLPPEKLYYILRPCMIHGPGNKGNLNLLFQFVKSGMPYPLASFHNKRSYLNVQNLCFIIEQLISRFDIESGIYNVADDQAISTNEVIKILSFALHLKPKFLKINTGFIRFLAKIGDVLSLPLTTERLDKLTDNYIVDNNKIKAVLQTELPLTTAEGLFITSKSFLQ